MLASPTQAEQAAIPRVLTVFLGPLGVRHPAKVRIAAYSHAVCSGRTFARHKCSSVPGVFVAAQ